MIFFVRPGFMEGRASFMIAECDGGLRRVVPDEEEGFLHKEAGRERCR
jgi:hypothetical protein